MPPNMQEELQQPLEKFGTDITALARECKLDPAIWRRAGRRENRHRRSLGAAHRQRRRTGVAER